MELSDLLAVARDNRDRRTSHYISASTSATSYTGYVVSATELQRLTNRYTVNIPALGVTLQDVPRMVPGAQLGSNGVGVSPTALFPGQPVVVNFQSGSGSQPYISGSLAFNGALSDWASAIPGIDQTDKQSKAAIYPSPVPPETLKAKGNANTVVFPFILRSNSPVHGNRSPAGIEVPGSRIVHDGAGNAYAYVAGQSISNVATRIEVSEGPKESLADSPNRAAIRKAEADRAAIVQGTVTWVKTEGGQYEPQEVHPANNGVLSQPAPSSNISPGSQPFTSTATLTGVFSSDRSSSRLGGSLSGSLSLGLNNSGLNEVMAKLQKILAFFQKANGLSGQQINFVQSSILPKVEEVQQLWGGGGLGGGLGGGVQQIASQVPKPAQTLLSSSALQKLFGGGLNLSGGSLSSLASIAEGNQSAQLPQISSEGGVLFGNLLNLLFSLLNLNGKRKNNRPSGLAPGVTRGQGPAIHRHISREYNDLDFSEYPGQALASYLSAFGMTYAGTYVRHLSCYVSTQSWFDFLRAIAAIADPGIGLALNLGVYAWVNETEEIRYWIQERTRRPGQITCLTRQDQYEALINAVSIQDVEYLEVFVREYLVLQRPSFEEWLRDPRNLVNWLASSDASLGVLANQILLGNVVAANITAIAITTGLDLTQFPVQANQLRALSTRAFNLPQAGIF